MSEAKNDERHAVERSARMISSAANIAETRSEKHCTHDFPTYFEPCVYCGISIEDVPETEFCGITDIFKELGLV